MLFVHSASPFLCALLTSLSSAGRGDLPNHSLEPSVLHDLLHCDHGGDDNHRGFHPGCFCVPHELHSQEPGFRRSELSSSVVSALPYALFL